MVAAKQLSLGLNITLQVKREVEKMCVNFKYQKAWVIVSLKSKLWTLLKNECGTPHLKNHCAVLHYQHS